MEKSGKKRWKHVNERNTLIKIPGAAEQVNGVEQVNNLLLQYGSGRTLDDLINKSGRNGLPVEERRQSEYELHCWSEEEDVSCFSVEESDTEETGSSNNPLKL